MSKLNIYQKSVKNLFKDKEANFLISDYLRPYEWTELECQTLWNNIYNFAIPEDDPSKFNSSSDENFLGSIVTFDNKGKKEVINGQQKLVSLMLLLRAFYSRLGNMRDENSVNTTSTIGRCLWKTDKRGKPYLNQLKIDIEVADDQHKVEFLKLLKNGIATREMKSNYANNYRFFEEKISKFLDDHPSYFPFLSMRILNNCIFLSIEAENQDTAVRICSTMKD